MPMPMWWRHLNKRFFNPYQLKRDSWPILRHVGRSSGKVHRTPIGAISMDDGFSFIVVYGSKSDWVQNVLASGEADLEIDGGEVPLTSPRLVTIDEAFSDDPGKGGRPPGFLNITQAVRMDTVEQASHSG